MYMCESKPFLKNLYRDLHYLKVLEYLKNRGILEITSNELEELIITLENKIDTSKKNEKKNTEFEIYKKRKNTILEQKNKINKKNIKGIDLYLNDNHYILNNFNYLTMIKNAQRKDKRKIFKTYNKIFDSFEDEYSELYKKFIENELLFCNKIGQEPLEYLLNKHGITKNIMLDLFKVSDIYSPIINNYFIHQQKKLAVSKLYNYDLYYKNSFDISKKFFSIEEAREILYDAFSVLGTSYLELLDKIFESENLFLSPDITNSYVISLYKEFPLIVIKWDGSIKSILSLAHEIGHAIHRIMADENQKFYESKPSIVISEIVAKVNEFLVLKILKNNKYISDDEYYELYINRFYGSVIRQTVNCIFEYSIFNNFKNVKISRIYANSSRRILGNTLNFEKEYGLHWMRIPHLFRPFYSSTYVLAFSIGEFLVDNKKINQKYETLLKSGGNKDLSTLLKDFDLNQSFDRYIEYSYKKFNLILSKLMEELQ